MTVTEEEALKSAKNAPKPSPRPRTVQVIKRAAKREIHHMGPEICKRALEAVMRITDRRVNGPK